MSPTSPSGGSDPVVIVVCYDIADDRRRENLASLLSGYGPRVQLSVFECEVRTKEELLQLRAELRGRIDPLEDQVRLYPTTPQTLNERYIIGARVVEERADYWIVR
jgi:CRISPR-associated protein Cas2